MYQSLFRWIEIFDFMYTFCQKEMKIDQKIYLVRIWSGFSYSLIAVLYDWFEKEKFHQRLILQSLNLSYEL